LGTLQLGSCETKSDSRKGEVIAAKEHRERKEKEIAAKSAKKWEETSQIERERFGFYRSGVAFEFAREGKILA
jgi:hypothetical protein